MEKSHFIEWVNKYFPGLTIKVVEKLNDSNAPLPYWHRRMLRPEFSVTGKWESISAFFSLVAADVVAMDSSLPLKKRDAISKASGDIPKMGIELKLNENQLTELNLLVAQNGTQEQILAKLFADTPKVIGGIYERNEAMFLEGLSTGVALVEDSENTGTAVRIDYGYKTENKFGVAVLWATSATAKPLDDIQKILDKASTDGNTITTLKMDRTAYNNMVKTTQVKESFAFYTGLNGGVLMIPSVAQLNNFLNDRYGFNIEIIDRSIRFEKNGVQTAVKPWQNGMVVALTNDQVGSLAWARLAEQDMPVAGVSYSTVDQFILVSKYRTNKPSLAEWTSAQARVVPVISNVDQIYTLDSTTVQA